MTIELDGDRVRAFSFKVSHVLYLLSFILLVVISLVAFQDYRDRQIIADERVAALDAQRLFGEKMSFQCKAWLNKTDEEKDRIKDNSWSEYIVQSSSCVYTQVSDEAYAVAVSNKKNVYGEDGFFLTFIQNRLLSILLICLLIFLFSAHFFQVPIIALKQSFQNNIIVQGFLRLNAFQKFVVVALMIIVILLGTVASFLAN